MINTAFPNDALKRTTIFEWYSRFKNGRITVYDDPRQGCPLSQRTEENVTQISNLIKDNRRITLQELEEETGISKAMIGNIIREDLGLKKTPAKFHPTIPH